MSSLNAQDWISNAIAFVGIVTTSVFSYLVWKVTKKQTDIAKNTLDLTIEDRRKQQELDAEYRNVHFENVVKTMESLLSIIETVKCEGYQASTKFHAHQRTLGVNRDDALKYFTPQERQLSEQFWEVFRAYEKKHWTEDNGNQKYRFPDGQSQRLQEGAFPLYEELFNIYERFKRLL